MLCKLMMCRGGAGGEKNEDLIAMQMRSQQPSAGILDHLAALVNRGKNTPAPAATSIVESSIKLKPTALAVVEKNDDGLAALTK